MIHDPPDEDVALLYNAGRLLLWYDLPITHLKELQKLDVHHHNKWKKLKSKDALSPVKNIKTHPLSVWTTDKHAAQAIQYMLRVTENEVRSYVNKWFSGYKLGPELNSWRYTITKDEPLHFDVYADRVQEKVLRVFINLDTEPRVWDVGPMDTENPGKYDIAYKANVIRPEELTVPAMRIYFQPGQVWAVDSRHMSHAIIYGRRAAMFSYQLEGIKHGQEG